MSLRYLLDTNVVSAPFKPRPPAALMARLDETAGACAIAALTWHELRFGHALLPGSRRKDALGRYIHEVVLTTFPVLAYDRPAAEWHAQERARLRKIGREPPVIDGEIAAVAAVNDLILVTHNVSDFAAFECLEVQDWTETADDAG